MTSVMSFIMKCMYASIISRLTYEQWDEVVKGDGMFAMNLANVMQDDAILLFADLL